MAEVILKKGRGHRVEGGHPWVYRNEVNEIKGEFVDGEVVDVLNYKGKFIGKGFINSKSQIYVRIITRKKEEKVDKKLIERKIFDAWNYRKKIGFEKTCRLIFAEADFLPGLIVDKFNDVLVLQILSKGMEFLKDVIIECLIDIIKPKAIYERNDVKVRELEGLPQKKGFLYGQTDTKIIIDENQVKMIVDIEKGQKTGYFLDQKENRNALQSYVRDSKVLDCFCHTGSFSIHAAKFGAKKVVGIDISDIAIYQSIENAKLNGVGDICEFKQANAFDLLNELDDKKEKYDVVILDPPAFAKNIQSVENAKRGYKEINLRAMRILERGGFLITCSCSQHITPEIFLGVIIDASKDAKKSIRLIEYRTQSKDHPYLIGYNESLYLKCYIFQII